jgi:hypothetical protein
VLFCWQQILAATHYGRPSPSSSRRRPQPRTCTVSAHSVTRHLGCRASMHRQKYRQGHYLAWRTCQAQQGERKKHAHADGLLTPTQGLRSRVDSSTEGENDEGFKQLISVSLRPDDPFAKRLLSTAVTTNNLLLKVTIPKRTGRRRKCGSSAPFLAEEEHEQSSNTTSGESRPRANKTYVDAPTIFQSLQDNASKYKVSLAGVIGETHRFRSRYQSM